MATVQNIEMKSDNFVLKLIQNLWEEKLCTTRLLNCHSLLIFPLKINFNISNEYVLQRARLDMDPEMSLLMWLFCVRPHRKESIWRKATRPYFVKDACAWHLFHILVSQKFNVLVQILRFPSVSEPPLRIFHANISFIYTADLTQFPDKSRLIVVMNHFWSLWFPVYLPLINSTVRYQCCGVGSYSFGSVFPLPVLIASQSPSYITTGGQAPIWDPRPNFLLSLIIFGQ
jgi:hypothetical protein